VRLDVALFELRLFKSRTQAQEAIAAGHVLVDGAAAKPSREIEPGARLTLVTPGARRTIEVLELPKRSLSREAAKAFVREI
jgi:ribosome-associated heat shock protein Hsp15